MRKTLLTLTLLALASALPAVAQDLWKTDFKAAKAEAAEEEKCILIDFTGSDWCGWCIALDEEVFDKKAFKDFAKENLVLVKADFPQNKKLPKKGVEQNEALAKEYEVDGYPTLVILDSEGEKLGQMGYVEGGPKAFLAELQKILDEAE